MMDTFTCHRLIAVAVASVLAFGTACQKQTEKGITEKELPQEVMTAFETSYPGASVQGYAREMDKGKMYYEISFEFKGAQIDILYNPEGEVVERETTISEEEMPVQIRDAVMKEVPDYSLILIERIEKDNQLYYEAKVQDTRSGSRYELFFSESGELLEKATMGDEEEQDI